MNASLSPSPVTTTHRFDDIEGRLTAATSRAKLFANKAFGRSLGERLDGMVVRDEMVLSLDVFDTLLLRDNSSEITRFYEIGGRMAGIADDARAKQTGGRRGNPIEAAGAPGKAGAPIRQVDAFLARHLGTKASYRACTPVRGCREGSLSDIHRTASRLLGLGEDFTETFVAAELEYETKRLKPNRFLLDYARRHRTRGGRTVLLTDMYMHEDQIRYLLAALGIEPPLFDVVISSADTKVSKASGGVFPLVEEAMDAAPADFIHLGDSLPGDFQRPRERGWQAMHLPLAEADIVERRRDHLATAEMLAQAYEISVDIAMPC